MTDLGLGYTIKHKMKNKFVAHYQSHHAAWEKGEIAPIQRKELHVKWLSESITDFYDNCEGQKMVEKIFARCGLPTPRSEEEEQLRKISGYDDPIVVDWSLQ